MRQYLQEFKDFGRKGDVLLLLMLLFTSAFGCLVIASATNDMGSTRFLIIQIGAIALGVLFYIAVSAIDLEFLSEHRVALVVFNTFLLALLLIVSGVVIFQTIHDSKASGRNLKIYWIVLISSCLLVTFRSPRSIHE